MTAGPLRTQFSRGLRKVRAAGGRRLLFTAFLLLMALLMARYSATLPITGSAEDVYYDFRIERLSQQEDQDDRILQVVYTDQTLIALRKRSPLDRGLLAEALHNLDGMGAKAIGLDMLFDQPQDEDDELVDVLRSMKTPVSVGYAELDTNQADIIYEQQQYLEEFLARLDGSNAHPASIRLNNSLGVTRNWPEVVAGLPPLLSLSMIADGGGNRAKAYATYEGPIKFRFPKTVDEPVFATIPIETFVNPDVLPYLLDQVQGRYVLVGGDLKDIDRVDTPFTLTYKNSIPGLEVHSHMVAQALDAPPLASVPGWLLWLQAAIVVVAASLTSLLEWKPLRVIPFMLAQGLIFLGLPYLIQAQGVDTYGLPAIGWLLGWVIAFSAVVTAARASGAVERRFAQSALGKYLPGDIAKEIIDKPDLLELHGTKKEIYVLFSDLEGFTKMSHALEPEQVATLLNRYLDMLSKVVLDHGGVIDKFVGDAVVAFWGAPISRPDDAKNAAQAGYAMWQAGEEFRNSVDPALPPIGKTRVGLHFGEAIVGNFGGEGRIQYTALGDSMNTAARLEAANKALDSNVMASREFAERSGLDWWRPMGSVVLRGRNRPVELFEPVPDFAVSDRHMLQTVMELLLEDRDKAIKLLKEIVSRNPADKSLLNLLTRLNQTEGTEAYVLG